MTIRLWPLIFVLFAFPFCGRAATPKVKLTYAEMFDFVCAKQTSYHIDPKWVDELTKRLPEFQANWQKSGIDLLDTAQAVVGKPFNESEFAVSLSVCSFPSMSSPLLINMRYSLASFISKPLPMDVTISIIFHELLHQYLRGKIPDDSVLIKKYQSENETVLSHIHLFALQKAVYLKLNRNDILQAVISKDQSLPNKSYTRAWEIVNDVEDFNSFVKELAQ